MTTYACAIIVRANTQRRRCAIMAKRRRMSRRKSRRNFRSGLKTHRKNLHRDMPRRGGYRM